MIGIPREQYLTESTLPTVRELSLQNGIFRTPALFCAELWKNLPPRHSPRSASVSTGIAKEALPSSQNPHRWERKSILPTSLRNA